MLGRVMALIAVALLIGCGDGSEGAGTAACVALDDPALGCRFAGRWVAGDDRTPAVLTLEAGEYGTVRIIVARASGAPRYLMWTGRVSGNHYDGPASAAFEDLDLFDEGRVEITLSDDGRRVTLAADGGSFFGPSTFAGRYVGASEAEANARATSGFTTLPIGLRGRSGTTRSSVGTL